jgi:hypothetical protein
MLLAVGKMTNWKTVAPLLGISLLNFLMPSHRYDSKAQHSDQPEWSGYVEPQRSQWSEIRENYLNGGVKRHGYGYTLVHACAEYGHETSGNFRFAFSHFLKLNSCDSDFPD